MNPRPLSILITKKADEDETSVYNYINRKFGKVYADGFRSKIIELFKRLAITPTAGRIARNDRSLRVFIFNHQNKVVYKTTDSEIIIIRILNAKRKSAAKY